MQRIRRLLGRTDPRSASRRRGTSSVALALALLLLSGVILAACNAGGQGTRLAALPEATPVCLSAEVTTGAFGIPAFNTASVRAMGQALERSEGAGLEPASSCPGQALSLQYSMTFDAQALNWRAELAAVDQAGEVVWQGEEAGAIPAEDAFAFQYMTEHMAETLLARFQQSYISVPY